MKATLIQAREVNTIRGNIAANLNTIRDIANAMALLGMIAPSDELLQAIDGIQMNVDRLTT